MSSINEFTEEVNIQITEAWPRLDTIVKAQAKQVLAMYDSKIDFQGFVNTKTPTPDSHTEGNAWIATQDGTIFGITASKGDLIFDNGTSYEVRNVSNFDYWTDETSGLCYRQGVVDDAIVVDRELTDTGFDGTQGTDWERLSEWSDDLGFKNPVKASRLNGVFYALAFDGANGGVKIQAAIDAAAAAGGGEVIVSGGPDDLSGYTAASYNKGWEITDTILHKDNVYITVLGGAYMFLADNTDKPMLENVDQVNGNQYLYLLGGVWDCNGMNQLSIVKDNRMNGFIGYLKCNDISISPQKVINMEQNYAMMIADGERWHFGDIEFFGYKDGLNIRGPANDITIDRISGETEDDILAMICDGYPGTEPSRGNITNVYVGEIEYYTKNYSGGRILLSSSSDIYLENITFNYVNLIDRSIEILGTDVFDADGQTRIHNLLINNLIFKFRDVDEFQNSPISIRSSSVQKEITINNVQNVSNNGKAYSFISMNGGGIVNNLNLNNINIEADSCWYFIWNSNGSQIEKINGTNIKFETENSSHYFILNADAGSVINKVILSNINFSGISTDKGPFIVSNSEAVGEIQLFNANFQYVSNLYEFRGTGTTYMKIINTTVNDSNAIAYIGDSVICQMTNCEINTDLWFFYIKDGGNVEVKAANIISSMTGDMFNEATSTYTIKVNGKDIRTDLDKLTPRKYDRVYNTNSGHTAGVGECIYQGTAWKNMDSI